MIGTLLDHSKNVISAKSTWLRLTCLECCVFLHNSSTILREREKERERAREKEKERERERVRD